MLNKAVTIHDVDELRRWVVEQIRFGHESKRWHIVQDEDGARLARTERTPWSSQKERHERVSLAAEIAGRLMARWPTSKKTGGRNQLGPVGVLQLVDPGAVAQVRREAARQIEADDRARRRESTIQEEARTALGTYESATAWLYTHRAELGGKLPTAAARESDEGLSAALAILQDAKCPECGSMCELNAGAYVCPPNRAHAHPVRWQAAAVPADPRG